MSPTIEWEDRRSSLKTAEIGAQFQALYTYDASGQPKFEKLNQILKDYNAFLSKVIRSSNNIIIYRIWNKYVFVIFDICYHKKDYVYLYIA